jgi:Cu+-exporting ATPase
VNLLVTLGATAAFVRSLAITLTPSLASARVRSAYYEEVGFILTLILIGRLLEVRAKTQYHLAWIYARKDRVGPPPG